MDKKDEIISMQLDLIRKMTENNIRRLGDDIWGNGADTTKDGKTNRAKDLSDTKKTDAKTGIRDEHLKSSADSDGGADTKPCIKEEAPEKLEDLMKELDSYIGLQSVKEEVKSLVNMMKVYKLRRDNGLPVTNISLHIVFSGNPGTGKTMIARFMARVYRSIGILSKGHLIETDRRLSKHLRFWRAHSGEFFLLTRRMLLPIKQKMISDMKPLIRYLNLWRITGTI